MPGLATSAPPGRDAGRQRVVESLARQVGRFNPGDFACSWQDQGWLDVAMHRFRTTTAACIAGLVVWNAWLILFIVDTSARDDWDDPYLVLGFAFILVVATISALIVTFIYWVAIGVMERIERERRAKHEGMLPGPSAFRGTAAVEYARRFPRFAAWIIDVIVIVVIFGILNGMGITDTFWVEEDETASVVHIAIQGIVGLGYFVVLTAVWGATLGKMAMGLKVVDDDGRKPGVGLVLLRQFLSSGLAPLPAIAVGLNAGGGISLLLMLVVVFWILVDDHRQGLHDKAARTFVVRA